MHQQLDPRQRIIEASSLLFVEQGLQSSMVTIAKTAKVATGSLYNYFPSKEGLILDVCRHLAAMMEEALVKPIDRSIPYRTRIEDYVLAYIEFIWADANRAFLYDYLTNSPSIELEQLSAIFSKITEHSIAVFSEAQEDGPEWGLSAKLAGSFVRGAIRNTLKRHRLTSETLTSEQRAGIVRMCWNALAS